MPPGNPPHAFPGFPTTFPLGSDELTEDQRAAEDRFLASVQGGILKGHGRDNARLVFFRFGDEVEKNRQLLRDAVADGWVQSALEQRYLSAKYRPREAKYQKPRTGTEKMDFAQRRQEIAQLLFGSLSLTRWGLIKIGCVDAAGLAPPRGDFHPNTWPESYWVGMRKMMEAAPVPAGHESLTHHWQEKPYTDESAYAFHGMFLLACDNVCEVERQYRRLKKWLADPRHGARVVHVEKGTTWRYKQRDNREPFGFVDGISQPTFFADDRKFRCPKEWEWVDLNLTDVFVTPEKSANHAGASFLAFVKFEQNVEGFRRHERRIRGRLGRPDGYHYAPAFGVGRWRDGHPLHHTWGPDRPAAAMFNSFDYDTKTERDPATSGCPFHAHIRKMNPRVNDPDHDAARHTIIRAQPVRRGMIYDNHGALQRRADAGRGRWPEKDVGLLFMAYMADVARQFERLHNDWAQHGTFPHPGNGEADGLLHPGVADWDWRGTTMPKGASFLKRLGGHYLYVPAIPWLMNGGSQPSP